MNDKLVKAVIVTILLGFGATIDVVIFARIWGLI